MTQDTDSLSERLEELTARTSQALRRVQELETALAESRAQVLSLTSELHGKATEITAVSTQALAAKTQILDAQAVIATKSEHIESAQVHADKVRAELDRTLTAATQQATETEGQRGRAFTAAEAATATSSELKAIKANVETLAKTVSDSRDEAVEASEEAKQLAARAESIDQKLGAYERELQELIEGAKAQLENIAGLLPGATSAGLAHAFDQRRQSFTKPSIRWQWLFVGSVLSSSLWPVLGCGRRITRRALSATTI